MRTLFTLSFVFLMLAAKSQLEGPFIVAQDGLSGFLTFSSDPVSDKIDKRIKTSEVVQVIPINSKYADANIFLLKNSNDSNKISRYKNAFQENLKYNTYKKINDSLYEIYIHNLAKEVLFGYRKNDDYGVGMKGTSSGGLNSYNMMGAHINHLIIKDGSFEKKYKVISFNPLLYGLELYLTYKKGKDFNEAVIFRILFQFPKPQLITATTDTALINRKKQNPSFQYADVYVSDTSKRMVTNIDKKNNSILFVFEKFLGYDRFAYQDNLLYKLDDANDWALTPLANTPSILLENISAGKHKLFVKYPAEKAEIFIYQFEVVASFWDSRFWDVLIGFLVAVLLLFFIFKIRLRNAKQKAQKTKLELQFIQAQLNPHFMFNALGSIQYLMNNNEKQKADHYLTEFGGLLRNSLSNNEKEMIPLSVELAALQTYVRLEQLRFNFQFIMNVDDAIEQENISVPSLLFQPLIENAIKHGISALKEKGQLTLNISQNSSNLIFEVMDNGTGFDTSKTCNGHGIRLVQQRIKILNKQGFEMRIDFSSNQKNKTTIKLIFENWL